MLSDHMLSSATRVRRAGPVRRRLFSLGRAVATPGALDALSAAGVSALALLRRHQGGDFSELDAEDRQSNWEAIETGARLLSSYSVGSTRIWVITEAADDEGTRASTCLLLPQEY
ncbi:hypothetical protein SRS16CHR_04308 [Variovorax sp. SRS16]|uniref:hypothetical protein n=1 Tax=Variovorax sp. SRS16 TaxID=282217 RepID=UPI0013194221|nr:hypothetical protein [Variovorax sp. SRS16]VTU28648.1 hypothetical protein SRS16CHR_04308 [Variovorax sp. SRS16]